MRSVLAAAAAVGLWAGAPALATAEVATRGAAIGAPIDSLGWRSAYRGAPALVTPARYYRRPYRRFYGPRRFGAPVVVAPRRFRRGPVVVAPRRFVGPRRFVPPRAFAHPRPFARRPVVIAPRGRFYRHRY